MLKILCFNPTIRKCQIHYLHDKKSIDFKLSSYRSKTITFKSIRKIAQSISKNYRTLLSQSIRKTLSITILHPIDCKTELIQSIRINLSIVHFQIDRLKLIDSKFTTYRFKSNISQSIDKKTYRL